MALIVNDLSCAIGLGHCQWTDSAVAFSKLLSKPAQFNEVERTPCSDSRKCKIFKGLLCSEIKLNRLEEENEMTENCSR